MASTAASCGTSSKWLIKAGSNKPERIPSKIDNLAVKAGDRIVFKTAGSGDGVIRLTATRKSSPAMRATTWSRRKKLRRTTAWRQRETTRIDAEATRKWRRRRAMRVVHWSLSISGHQLPSVKTGEYAQFYCMRLRCRLVPEVGRGKVSCQSSLLGSAHRCRVQLVDAHRQMQHRKYFLHHAVDWLTRRGYKLYDGRAPSCMSSKPVNIKSSELQAEFEPERVHRAHRHNVVDGKE